MSRRTGVVVAVAALLVAVVAAGVGAAVTMAMVDGDSPRAGHRGQMMGSPRGGPMGGSMHGSPVESEYAYLAEMVAHHEEAVAAARHLARSDRAEMREFGESIIASQSAQIDQMERWLAEWYPDRSGKVDYDPMMRDLSDLTGDRLDRAFLEDMLGHHMGAVMMSQQLLARRVADHPEVEELAATIRDEQHDEIFQMQRWLRDWTALAR